MCPAVTADWASGRAVQSVRSFARSQAVFAVFIGGEQPEFNHDIARLNVMRDIVVLKLAAIHAIGPLSNVDGRIMAEILAPIVFDKQHALARLGGLEDVLVEVMELMTTESTKVHAELGASFRRGDVVGLKRSAHTLKGSVGIVGAKDLVRRLRHVEESAKVGELTAAATEFEEIDRQFAELQRILSDELNRN